MISPNSVKMRFKWTIPTLQGLVLGLESLWTLPLPVLDKSRRRLDILVRLPAPRPRHRELRRDTALT